MSKLLNYIAYSLRSKNLENLNPYEVRYVMSKALAVWSKHSQLTFTEVDSDNADILIYFYRKPRRQLPLRRQGVVLAHAFFPTGVRSSIEVHFDADEIWTTSGNSEKDGTNLFNVAAHEVGHSLGLSHSNVEDALMYPWYKEMEDGFEYELPEDDKQAIQYLYGSRDPRRNWGVIPEYRPVHKTTTTTTTTTTPRPTPRYTRPAQRPYDPRYPYGRHPYNPYSPQRPDKPYNPNKPMHPDKKPHYPKHKGGQDPYRPDRKSPHHKNTSDRTPDRSYPDQGYPTRSYPTSNPDKHPTHNPERNHPRHEPPKESPTTMPPPETCNTSYDAVAVIRREVFIFKDAYFWRIGEEGLMPGYPAEIRRLWHEPALRPESRGRRLRTDRRPDRIFRGRQVLRVRGKQRQWGYPKPLAHLGCRGR
ncbi:hypothetical protein NQ317_009101 [Molorchus minor]|uniref:Peptidase metallopeptidase domain-containing protein n=1 Tax=Molorchus minor TaxID=1323400 RepID=A0ABQ9J9E7_9CUCU|nr:hypothetical protein NQ317_009101 [Molorchus minor]